MALGPRFRGDDGEREGRSMNRPVSDTAAALIAQLGLGPHPEGGHFRETYRHRPADGSRGHATLIYYLLQAGEGSHRHRGNDADELRLFHASSAPGPLQA